MATFDDIERDKKINTEAQLSLIAGTMGLLTGFSIISGVEIIFFPFRAPRTKYFLNNQIFPGKRSEVARKLVKSLFGTLSPGGVHRGGG